MNRLQRDLEWHRLHYQHLVDALENSKRRQWSIPYYILLLFAAVIGFYNLLDIPANSVCVLTIHFLIFISLLFSVLGVYHVFDNHFAQERYRSKMIRFGRKYSSAFRHEAPIEKQRQVREYLFTLSGFFSFIITSGFICVVLFLTNSLKTIILYTSINIIINAIIFILKRCQFNNFVKSLPRAF